MKGDVSAAGTSTGLTENELKSITLLMPVWGYRFTGRFLEFCLPTLLAPNNIPALARELPCRFVLLSSESDERLVRSHPAWQKLARFCTVEFQAIDDLITEGNHTATLTLAFERAVRQAGPAMRHTCFFFLMSDYLVADGSLRSVLAAIQRGARGVLVGNFQVTTEDAVPVLRAELDSDPSELLLRPRQLMQWSLRHLHPATMANIVNFGLTHNDHTNRLFWRVDDDTLIGRFYLMHPIAIRPEVTDFVVGSSWDYSFIPELCPSGNIATLTDSDDYLVVELQRRDYENENLRLGPIDAAELATSLAVWTTARHRANIEQTLVFHAAARPPNLPTAVAQADAFVRSVQTQLTTPPTPHTNHPFWIGSLAVNRRRARRPLTRPDWAFLLSESAPKRRLAAAFQRLRGKLFGFPPDVTPLHPWWPEYQLPGKALSEALAANGRVLLVAHNADIFAQWVTHTAGDIATINCNHLLNMPWVAYSGLVNTFDACLLSLDEHVLGSCDALIERVQPLLKADGKIHVLLCNYRFRANAAEFSRAFARQAGQLSTSCARIKDVRYVAISRLRLSVRNVAQRLLASAKTGSAAGLAAVVLAAGPILFATYFANRTARSSRTPPDIDRWSSIFVTLQASAASSPALPRFEGERTLDRRALGFREKARQPAIAPEERFGSARSALMSGNLWPGEVSRFAANLASYRFVASLLAGRHDVAEVGCASAFGTGLVLQKVRKLRLFDPRQTLVGEMQQRFGNDSAFEGHVHNILKGPLSRQVDSVYSIDFIQHLSRDEEQAFMRHLLDSLARDFDFLLIGCPSHGEQAGTAEERSGVRGSGGAGQLHSMAARPIQQTPQPQSADPQQSGVPTPPHADGLDAADVRALPVRRRIYRRSAEELQALVERYIHAVFVFSAVDDIVHPGIHANARHVFVLGCGRKR